MAEADRLLKEFSVARIRDLAKSNKPFFLEHCFMKVHADNFASKSFDGKSGSKYPYKDAIVEVDAYIGEIMNTLKTAGVLVTPSSLSPRTTARRWTPGRTKGAERDLITEFKWLPEFENRKRLEGNTVFFKILTRF